MTITYVAVSPFISSWADTFTIDTSSSIETVWFASSCNFWGKKFKFCITVPSLKLEKSSLVHMVFLSTSRPFSRFYSLSDISWADKNIYLIHKTVSYNKTCLTDTYRFDTTGLSNPAGIDTCSGQCMFHHFDRHADKQLQGKTENKWINKMYTLMQPRRNRALGKYLKCTFKTKKERNKRNSPHMDSKLTNAACCGFISSWAFTLVRFGTRSTILTRNFTNCCERKKNM